MINDFVFSWFSYKCFLQQFAPVRKHAVTEVSASNPERVAANQDTPDHQQDVPVVSGCLLVAYECLQM